MSPSEDRGSADADPFERPGHAPSDDAGKDGREVEPLKESAEDDVLPVSPGRRRAATVIGLVMLAAILGCLVVFIATHMERSDGGSMLGTRPPSVPAAPGVA